MAAEIIFKYFQHLSDRQRQQFEQLDELYRDWNAKINVISRKDIDGLYLRYIPQRWLAIVRCEGLVKVGSDAYVSAELVGEAFNVGTATAP